MSHRKLVLAAIAAVLWLPLPVSGQVDTAWVRRYAIQFSSEETHDLEVGYDGSVYIAAERVTLKYASDGSLLWSTDGCRALEADTSGNVYATGFGGTFTTRKYNSSGLLAWELADSTGVATALVIDEAGNAYTAGSGFLTRKISPDGSLLWEVSYDGPLNNDYAAAITLDAWGNIIVTGSSQAADTYFDIVTIKYDTDGQETWLQRWCGYCGDSWDLAVALVADDLGNVFIAGQSSPNSSPGGSGYAVLRYNSAGNVVWEQRYIGPLGIETLPTAIALDNDRNVYVTGKSFSPFCEDFATLKFDFYGNLLRERRYGGTDGCAHAWGLAVTGAGDVYVTGCSGWADCDFATVHYTSDGDLVWEVSYVGPPGWWDEAFRIALDQSRNLVVVGESRDISGPSEIVTIKYLAPCICDCDADPFCDGQIDVLDITSAVEVAFRGRSGIPDPSHFCPVEDTDTDCNGVTDVLDVTRFVAAAFRGADPIAVFCDPCL